MCCMPNCTWAGIGVTLEKAINDNIRDGVTKDEGPPTRREDNDGDLSTAQNAELVNLFEKTSSTLGEGDL